MGAFSLSYLSLAASAAGSACALLKARLLLNGSDLRGLKALLAAFNGLSFALLADTVLLRRDAF